MGKKRNKSGGGANTNKNGLAFEKKACLLTKLKKTDNISVNENNEVFKNDTLVGLYCPKYSFYKKFLKVNGIDWRDRISKQLLPDIVFVNYQTKTIYFGDNKFQKGPGSADEKIETAHYKHFVLSELCEDLGYKIDYFYLLNDWFLQKKYNTVKKYLDLYGYKYYFNEIPIEHVGL
jgi:hypothetical protein